MPYFIGHIAFLGIISQIEIMIVGIASVIMTNIKPIPWANERGSDQMMDHSSS